MKNLKKLSLEDEINREAEEIEKKVKENKEIEGMTVSEDMETALFNKIQEYEYDKRLKKVVYRKKKRTYVIGAIAAIIILICGSVMTSVGSKSYVKVLWERINGDESSNIINVEDMDSKKSKDVDEGTVYKELAKTFGDYLLRMGYRPKDMQLIRYSIDVEQRKGTLFYQYNDEIVRYSMYLNDDDSSFGQKEVDTKSKEYNYKCEEFIADVKEYTVEETKQKRYVADFEYMGIHYQLKGCLPKEELEEILKNLIFSKKRVSFSEFSCLYIQKGKEKNMKKRILSVMSSLVMAGCILGTSSVAVNAQENEKIVDGSALTTNDTSTGRTENGMERGIHLMDGECSISKAGISRVYCYGSTTANHEVDKLAVIVRVEQCEEDSDDWGQVDWFVEMKETDYFVYATKTVTVDRGYYYRVWASHIVRKGDDPVEETYSYTDGIKVP